MEAHFAVRVGVQKSTPKRGLCLQKNSTKRVKALLAKEPYKKRALFTKDFWFWNWRGRGGIHIRSAPLFAPASPTSPGTPKQVH